jgi:hypothetical protein
MVGRRDGADEVYCSGSSQPLGFQSRDLNVFKGGLAGGRVLETNWK